MGVAVAKKADVSVKIDPDVYRMVRTVAAWRGINVAEYLSEIVAPIAKRDLAKMNKEIEQKRNGGEDAE
jgi:hypothetical protein